MKIKLIAFLIWLIYLIDKFKCLVFIIYVKLHCDAIESKDRWVYFLFRTSLYGIGRAPHDFFFILQYQTLKFPTVRSHGNPKGIGWVHERCLHVVCLLGKTFWRRFARQSMRTPWEISPCIIYTYTTLWSHHLMARCLRPLTKTPPTKFPFTNPKTTIPFILYIFTRETRSSIFPLDYLSISSTKKSIKT